jgi:hypothetical protein
MGTPLFKYVKWMIDHCFGGSSQPGCFGKPE